MPKGDILSIASPAEGLMVFDTDRGTVNVFAGGDWRELQYM
jgi:hypothetical protein